jgi:hypothetical protein
MNIKIEKWNDGIRVEAPYHEGFTREARQIGGVWTKQVVTGSRGGGTKFTPGYWTFAVDTKDLVDELLFRFYGHGRMMKADTVNLKMTWIEDVSGDPIMVGDRIVCQGGRVGENVAKLTGEIEGSPKSKKTQISSGTSIMVYAFPRDKAESLIAKGSSNCLYEIEKKDASKEEIQEEIRRLSARIEELKRLLKEKTK